MDANVLARGSNLQVTRTFPQLSASQRVVTVMQTRLTLVLTDVLTHKGRWRRVLSLVGLFVVALENYNVQLQGALTEHSQK